MTTAKLAAAVETETEPLIPESDDGPNSDDIASESDSPNPESQSSDEEQTLDNQPAPTKWRVRVARMMVFVAIPLLVMSAGVGAAWMKYQDAATRAAQDARVESMHVASDATIAMLSYTPDTAEAKLTAAANLLTGSFRNSYETLVKSVVIPGARQKQISATATVAGAATVSATQNSAVVLVFVDQEIVVGKDAPANTASAVEVKLTKVGAKWLISGFEPR